MLHSGPLSGPCNSLSFQQWYMYPRLGMNYIDVLLRYQSTVMMLKRIFYHILSFFVYGIISFDGTQAHLFMITFEGKLIYRL